MALQFGRLPGVTIQGTGAYFPPHDVTNDDIFDLILDNYFVRDDRHNAWQRLRHGGARLCGRGLRQIMRHRYPTQEAMLRHFSLPANAVAKLGVERRQWAHRVGHPIAKDTENSSNFALHAARAALDDAELFAADIDALVVSSTTPARLNSSTALWLAEKLGIAAPAYDLRAGCSGGLYGLLQAAMYLQHGCRHVLVVGAEAYSRFVSPTNRDAIFLAGDGAGAVIVGPGSNPTLGVLGGLMGADGRYDARFHTLGPMPPSAEAAARGHYYVHGDPRDLVEVNFKKYLEIIPAVLGLAATSVPEIGYHVPHQTSLGVITAVARHLDLSMERTFVNIQDHGNVGSACLLAGLHEARNAGKLVPGERLLLSVVGGSMTWAAMVLQQ